MSGIRTCSECGAKVLWLENNNTHRLAPIDAEPVEYGGNIEVLPDDNGEICFYRVLAKGTPRPPGSFRQSHFVTCPAAQRVRERTKARG